MLPEELSALAAAAATGIVQAAGTDAWTAVRERVARLLRRGRPEPDQAARAERTAMQRLDDTGQVLAAAADRAAVSEQEHTMWRTRLRDFLEDLSPEEQAAAVHELNDLLADTGEAPQPPSVVHADHSGVTAGGNISNQGGAIGRDFSGSVTIGNVPRPTPPGTAQR